MCFEDFVFGFPHVENRGGGGGDGGGQKREHMPHAIMESLLDEFPWLSPEDVDFLASAERPGTTASGVSGTRKLAKQHVVVDGQTAAVTHLASSELTEEVFWAVRGRLLAARD